MQRKESDMPTQPAAIEAAEHAASAALKVVVAGTGLAGTGVVIDSTTIALLGLLVTVASFGVNWFYRHKEYRLKKRALEREATG